MAHFSGVAVFLCLFLRLEYVFRVTAPRLVQCKVFTMSPWKWWNLLRPPETSTTPVVKSAVFPLCLHEEVSIVLLAG